MQGGGVAGARLSDRARLGPASELESALHRYGAPWRRRRRRELALGALALAIAFACVAFSAIAACAAAALVLLAQVIGRRGTAHHRLVEIEAHLGTGGALGAALESSTAVPLAALARRHFARRLLQEAGPDELAVRPLHWLVLGAALFVLSGGLGLSAEVARRAGELAAERARERSARSSAAARASELPEEQREIARAAEELGARRARGELGAAEHSAALERLARSYARPRADSSMSRSAAGSEDSSSRGAGAAGAGSEPPPARAAEEDSEAGGAAAGSAAWAELPERYRRRVARYFGRRD